MKHGKKPTLKQKKELTKHKLNYENWFVVKDTPKEFKIVNRNSGKFKTFNKNK